MGNNQSSSASSSTSNGHASGSMKPSGSSSSLRSRSRSSTVDSSSRAIIDGGFLEPQSLLYSHVEYHRPTVHKLIIDHKLSPFYLGLNDFEEDWDVDKIVQALAEAEQTATQNLKDALAAAVEAVTEAEATQINAPTGTRKHKDATQLLGAAIMRKERLAELVKLRDKRGGGGLQWTSKTDQAKLYRERALECPICFLYYPPNMVHTRCCDQPICTECFVQIKRAEPTPTHLESEPAACPFCMEVNFGCVYTKPTPTRPIVQHSGSGSSSDGPTIPQSPKPRRKSFAHTEKEVVTTDMLHPDWETKLEAMKATVARRANRRIVFRQVGDRLIPVGITSGRQSDGANATMATQTLPPDFLSQIAAALDQSNPGGSSGSSGGGGGRSGFRVRSSRRRGGSSSGDNDEVSRLLESLGLGGGPDLEEMMLQEAMRLSQLEEEERQKKVKEEEAKKAVEAPAGASSSPTPTTTTTVPSSATESALSEAMNGTLSESRTTNFPANPTTAPSIHTTTPPSGSSDRSPVTTPTASSFPAATSSSSGAPVLPPIAPSSTSAFDPLAPSVSRSSETSSMVQTAPLEGYEPLDDGSEVETETTTKDSVRREHVESSTQSGQLIDI
ncbi:Sip5p [Sporobolomyces koalae]|uniref:Sip5p n=1 Tax=Sporobolomyces koalae TaxID=500713 RepID=UPI0031774031